MDATLNSLGGILLKAVPTICLLLLVHFYLKFMFFRPLQEVLAKRRAATAGAREAAEATRAKVQEQAQAIEVELTKAREEIYAQQEEARKRWVSEQTARLEEARQSSRATINQAKEAFDVEVKAAKSELAATSEALADQIVRALLERKAS